MTESLAALGEKLQAAEEEERFEAACALAEAPQIQLVPVLVQAVWDSGTSAVGRLHEAVSGADGRLTVENVGPETGGAVFLWRPRPTMA